MFSGIVEIIGIIKKIEMIRDCMHITILPQKNLANLKIGDSIAVNGVCLTVTKKIAKQITAVIVPETLRLTNLKNLTVNAKVNLERSMKINSRVGGHYVQGHVDGEGEIIELLADGDSALTAKIRAPLSITRYMVRKGYVTIDGMSITLIEVGPEWFTVTFIPHTQEVSIVQHYGIKTRVNIEVDIMGKYIEKLLGTEMNDAVIH